MSGSVQEVRILWLFSFSGKYMYTSIQCIDTYIHVLVLSLTAFGEQQHILFSSSSASTYCFSPSRNLFVAYFKPYLILRLLPSVPFQESSVVACSLLATLFATLYIESSSRELESLAGLFRNQEPSSLPVCCVVFQDEYRVAWCSCKHGTSIFQGRISALGTAGGCEFTVALPHN